MNSGKLFDWGSEKESLLSDIDEGDFYKFLRSFEPFLKRIVGNLKY